MYSEKTTLSPPSSAALDDSGNSDGDSNETTSSKMISSPRMMSLWKRAIESNKALLLDETDLGPDALLEKVEEFEGMTQASEHSYPARVLSSEDGTMNLLAQDKVSRDDKDFDDWPIDDDDEEKFEDYSNDAFEEAEPAGPLGSLPVDLIAKRLQKE